VARPNFSSDALTICAAKKDIRPNICLVVSNGFAAFSLAAFLKENVETDLDSAKGLGGTGVDRLAESGEADANSGVWPSVERVRGEKPFEKPFVK